MSIYIDIKYLMGVEVIVISRIYSWKSGIYLVFNHRKREKREEREAGMVD